MPRARMIVLIVWLLLVCYRATAFGALACDGNGDGRTSIDELVAGVAAAMAGNPCGCNACPAEACLEFPGAVIDGEFWVCATEVCDGNQEACVRALYREPLRCQRQEQP